MNHHGLSNHRSGYHHQQPPLGDQQQNTRHIPNNNGHTKTLDRAMDEKADQQPPYLPPQQQLQQQQPLPLQVPRIPNSSSLNLPSIPTRPRAGAPVNASANNSFNFEGDSSSHHHQHHHHHHHHHNHSHNNDTSSGDHNNRNPNQQKKRFRPNNTSTTIDDDRHQPRSFTTNDDDLRTNLDNQPINPLKMKPRARSNIEQNRAASQAKFEQLEQERHAKELKYQRSLKNLSVHSWFQVENAQQRQILFCKTKIAFPELPVAPPLPQSNNNNNNNNNNTTTATSRTNSSSRSDSQPPSLDTLPSTRSTISITTNAESGEGNNPSGNTNNNNNNNTNLSTISINNTNTSAASSTTSAKTRGPAVGREQCPLLFDSTPRIIGNDMDASVWSKSITCLLNQSCDAVYTFICTLCYYFKILRILASNYNRVIQLHVPVPLTGNEPKNPDGDFIRQKQVFTITLGSKESKHLFFIACNILSMKFHDDFYHTNRIFSKVYKLPIQFLNELEMKCYALLGWNLYLSDVMIGQVLRELVQCIDPFYKSGGNNNNNNNNNSSSGN